MYLLNQNLAYNTRFLVCIVDVDCPLNKLENNKCYCKYGKGMTGEDNKCHCKNEKDNNDMEIKKRIKSFEHYECYCKYLSKIKSVIENMERDN